jgi:hypothetical protein
MSYESDLISRREAVQRVALMLGGATLVGGGALLTACERERPAVAAGTGIGKFTAEDIAFLDEIAETILPETKTPGAKAAQTGAFMALMVTDAYDAKQQRIFRDGMRKVDDETKKMHNVGFMAATPQQRLSVLQKIDREAKAHGDARERAIRRKQGLPDLKPEERPIEAKSAEAHLPDQRQEAAPSAEAGAATSITADTPAHYFRMMKELALLGYFTSEIGCKQAQRYVESPGRYDPCVPYTPGEKAWAPHA